MGYFRYIIYSTDIQFKLLEKKIFGGRFICISIMSFTVLGMLFEARNK